MSLLTFALAVSAALCLGYRFYSRWLESKFDLSDARVTPAVEHADGVDFVPISQAPLLAQHFSAIAAAGPIVGPILAGIWFGWLPAILWIVFGNIFIGAVHDFATLVASVRHRARNVAELMREYVSPRAWLLFMAFMWVALVYVIVAFADLTARAFVEPGIGPGVATSSLLYLALAVGMGVLVAKLKAPMWLVTALTIPLLALVIWSGQFLPITLDVKSWALLILAYCFLASVLPMWVLLQPRGMLGGWFLYGALGIAVLGIALGGYTMQYPAFIGWSNPKGLPLFPLMFITIACGACSGFHGLVCSGTTSKQLSKESHARGVGYGGMLLEGGVALIALCTVAMLPLGDPALKLDPNVLYARGLAKFAGSFGIPVELAASFGLLAFATFVYDTLDVATRLGRYVLQELTGWTGRAGAMVSTAVTLGVPALFLMSATDKAYMKFWGVFGASNQLLAALGLLGIAVWLKRIGKPTWIALVPMVFVMAMTLWALGLQARKLDAAGITSAVLILVAGTLLVETVRALKAPQPTPVPVKAEG